MLLQQERVMYDERIDPFFPNDCYYAHLSIYHFASQFCVGKNVLDAGCGTGYGSAYLAEHGAKYVYGIDQDSKTIESAENNFQRPNLKFGSQDLGGILGFADKSFDLIFASNSLEHVNHVEIFFHSAWRLLNQNGILIVAVPAARTVMGLAEELSNPHHLNIWSPRQWFAIHQRHFKTVRCFTHILLKQNGVLRIDSTPEDTIIRENDFSFEEVPIEKMYEGDSHSAIFLASNPLPEKALPDDSIPMPMFDHSISRPLRPAWMHPFIWAYYRVLFVARYQGVGSLIGKVFSVAGKFVGRRCRVKKSL